MWDSQLNILKRVLEKIDKKYIIFGGSIIVSRGLEYLVLLFSALYLDKNTYGQLEFYKKIIEVASVFFSFGFPALILSYTKSDRSKDYFYILALICVCVLTITFLPILYLYDLLFLVTPFLFYAIFFNGGVTPIYLLVKKGSNYASKYKILISCLFYGVLFFGIFNLQFNDKAYIKTSEIVIIFLLVYIIYELVYIKIDFWKLKKYFTLFKKILINSATLVISNFANIMFLYTDIFILNHISPTPNTEIADFSFALNISSLLLLIPMTLVQVDIESLKKSKLHFSILNKKINHSLVLTFLILILTYMALIKVFVTKYDNTLIIFLVLLTAKFCHAKSSLYGTYLVILKKFKINLVINLIALLANILAGYYFYLFFGIIGLSFSSLILLFVRLLILKAYKNKFYILI